MARSPKFTSEIMRRVRSTSTPAEVRLRLALWHRGLRYRIAPSHLPGKPDIVLPSRRVAVFVDGDYWHGNQWQRRGLASLEQQFSASKPETRAYWLRKIRRNMQRDADVASKLLSAGWLVLRFWESDVDQHLNRCVECVMEAVETPPGPDVHSVLAGKTVAEFFAGIGLMRLGLESNGWRVTFANDIDPQKLEMYKSQFPEESGQFVMGDINTLSASDIPSVSLATASFPCTDLSLAGGRKGLDGKQSSAFWGFVRLLDEMGDRRPSLILLENVTGFLTSDGGRDFESAMLALNRLGYWVDPFVLDAAWFVPQSRQRLFVVGKLAHGRVLRESPQPSMFYESKVRPRALAKFVFTHPEIQWELRALPDPSSSDTRLPDVIEDLPDTSPAWWSADRAAYLLSQMSGRHREIANSLISGEEWSYGTVFRRVRSGKSMAELRTDGIAGCLRTPKGGSGRQILFKAGKGRYQVRLLTARECARLMGAGEYKLTVPLNQALFGFGDAVAVPAVAWVAQYYLNPLVNELLHGRALIAAGRAY
jgi:DNA (cytosine-5)-methyltransferase 1